MHVYSLIQEIEFLLSNPPFKNPAENTQTKTQTII